MRREEMKRKTAIVVVTLCVACTAVADSITIDGVTHEDVYIREGAARYFVQIPADGRVISVGKDEVNPGDVSISADAARRDELLKEWRRANAERHGETVPSDSARLQDVTESVRTDARILHFPEDCVGYVEVKDAPERRHLDTCHYWLDQADWHFLARAQGNVVVPEGKYVALRLTEPVRVRTSPLAALHPDDVFEARLAARGSNPAPGNAMFKHLTTLTGLRVLHLQRSAVTEQGLAELAAFQSLKRLSLPNGVGDAGFAHVASVPSLEGLYFYESRVTADGLSRLEALPLLTELSFSGDRITDSHLAHLAKLPRLDYLKLSGDNITNAGMAHVAKVRSLRILNASYSKISDDGVRHVSTLPNLELLSLYNVPAITGKALEYLSRVPRLRKLDLNDRAGCESPRFRAKDMVHVAACRSLEDLALPDTMGDEALAHLVDLKNLKRLWVCNSKGGLSDEGLDHISRMTALEELTLQGGDAITDQGFAYLARLRHLRKLSLPVDSRNVTNEGWAHLTKLTELRHLSLRHYGKDCRVTLSAVSAFNVLTNLEVLLIAGVIQDNSVLDISALTNLDNLTLVSKLRGEGLHDQDLACLAGLTKLRWLQGIRGVSDAGLAHLSGLTRMERLNIAGDGITEAGLAHLANMKSMDLLGVTGHFTEQGLSYLEKLPALRYLTVNGLEGVSEARLRRFEDNMPMLCSFNLNTR